MKNKLKKFNASDVIIVVGILAVICGILFRNPVEKLFSDLFYQKNIEYVVIISAEDERLLDEGAEIKDARGESLGVVKLIKPDALSKDENGVFSSYSVTIETVGMTDKLGTYIGNSQFIAPRVAFEIYSLSGEPIKCVVRKVESDS